MAGAAVVQAGVYQLEIDTGVILDAFTLDDPTQGVLNNTNFVLDGTTSFADVSTGTTNIRVKRGRRDSGDQFTAGTMSFTLDDTYANGVFNPFDTASPFYDTTNNKPGLAPLRKVILSRYDTSNVKQELFNGYIVNYDYTFQLGGLNTVTVFCNDEFYLLAQTVLDEHNTSAETSGERINTVLALPEVNYTGATDIASGTVNLGHGGQYKIENGTNVLAYLSQINDTAEFGRLFVDREGVLTFQNRIGNTFSAPTVTFADTGTETPYDTVGITFEADQVINRASVTALNGNTRVETDTNSIATYFTQTKSITNSLLAQQGQIDAAAAYLLNGEPEARYTDVGVSFASLTNTKRDTVAIVDIGDTIAVEKTFTVGISSTGQLGQELAVEGIEHEIDVNSGHRVTFFTSPTTIVYLLVLDDPNYGIIDANNVLG
jgi:Tfp pilus assembly protein FimT